MGKGSNRFSLPGTGQQKTQTFALALKWTFQKVHELLFTLLVWQIEESSLSNKMYLLCCLILETMDKQV